MKTRKYNIFMLITDEETKKCKVILGNNLIDECDNEQKAIKKIDSKPWGYILKLIIVVVDNILKIKKEEEHGKI